MKYSFSQETPVDESVELASRRVKVRRELIDALGGDVRGMREYSSDVILAIARTKPELLVEFEVEIIDALHRPEPMTRYNTLMVIHELTALDAKIVDKAFGPIEDCLYDEDSGAVRFNAFRALALYGGTTPIRSEKVWPYLSDAVRCFHGDSEFIPMLNDLIAMLEAKASDNVKIEAGNLFFFDSTNGRGQLKRKSAQVVALSPEPPQVIEVETEE